MVSKISMKKIFIILVLFASVSSAYAKIQNINDTSDLKSKTLACQDYKNLKTELKINPGYYYYRMASCESASIHDEKTFYRVVNLFEKSASNQYQLSNFALGFLFASKYQHGSSYYGVEGKPVDLIYAIKYYTKASEYGSATAENNLGEIYLNYANISDEYRSSRQVDVDNNKAFVQLPDIDKAIYWLERAAKHGNPAAQGTLADLYKQGIGVPQDYVLSYVWSNLSIASQLRFNNMMRGELGQKMSKVFKSSRDELYKNLSVEQKNLAQSLLQEYKAKYFIRPNQFDSVL